MTIRGGCHGNRLLSRPAGASPLPPIALKAISSLWDRHPRETPILSCTVATAPRLAVGWTEFMSGVDSVDNTKFLACQKSLGVFFLRHFTLKCQL